MPDSLYLYIFIANSFDTGNFTWKNEFDFTLYISPIGHDGTFRGKYATHLVFIRKT
jgi:hypothetical protein